MAFSLAANLAQEPATTRTALHLGLLVATGATVLLLGEALGRRVWQLWRARRCDIEVLFVTGIAGALSYSIYSTFVTGGSVYYEVVSILLALYGLSQRLKISAQNRVKHHLAAALLREEPAWVLQADGQSVPVPAQDVRCGATVVVHPGRPIVVDGTVSRGQASVQTLALTGEPFGRAVGPGDRVFASWLCLDATLHVEVTAPGHARRIDQLAALVVAGTQQRDALTHRPASATLALTEQLARIFSPVVMFAACATFLGWSYASGWEVAWLNALAVLLVACPCALGFAVPLALRVGVLRLASLGLSVRSLAAIERLARVKRVAIDKTGTLTAVEVRTEALVRVADLSAASSPPLPQPLANLDAASLLAIMQAAQRCVDHPIAAAFARIRVGVPCPWRVVEARLLPGVGIEALFADKQTHYRVQMGEPAQLGDASWKSLARHLPAGAKALGLRIDEHIVAVAALQEVCVVAADKLFGDLADRRLTVAVLSGDTDERVARLQAPTAEGALRPEDKLARVRAWQHRGEPTCFVGDGLNDTAAMAFSDASICVSSGTALAREVADITLPIEQLAQLPVVIDICRQAMTTARISIGMSVSYNCFGMSLAAAGYLNPVWASLLMLGSSLSVSASSAWLWHCQAEAQRATGLSTRWASPSA